MTTTQPNEKAEARAVGIWLARGFGLSLFGGVLWALPVAAEWLRILAMVAAVILGVLAVCLSSLAATITRNIIGRYFQLHARPRTVFAMGFAIFAGYVAIMLAFFLIGASLVSPG